MRRYTIYDKTTGAVREHGVNRAANVAVPDGMAVAWDVRADRGTHYIDPASGEPVERASMTPSVSTSTGQAEITNLPDPCQIAWGGQSAEATGGSATITFDEPGTYTLTLRAEPAWLEHTLEVEIP